MPDLWTPDQANAERNSVVEGRLRDHIAAGVRLERELKKLDPYLEVGFIGDRAPAYPGIIPGRWHVIRRNPEGLDLFLPIAGPDGEYLEPNVEAILAEMRARDLHRPGAVEKRMKAVRDEWDRKKREQDLWEEQNRDEAAHVYRTAKRVAGDGGMTRRLWAKGKPKGIAGHG